MDAAAITAAEIAPDVVPADSLGALNGGKFVFTYGHTDYDVADHGLETITPSVSANKPTAISATKLDASHFYTVIVTDPDAPSRANPAFREFVHACWQNIPGSAGNLMGVGDVSCPYIGPGPPYSTGKHRYVFLLYDQGESKVDTHAAQEAFENRGGCKAHKFAVEQGFTGPLAVSAFESEWEEFVDGVHAAIGFVPPPEFQSPGQKAAIAAEAAAAEGGKAEEGDESKTAPRSGSVHHGPRFREWMAVAAEMHGGGGDDDDAADGNDLVIKTEDAAFYEPMGEWMFKRGHKWHTWHKRYGKLDGNKLTYYTDMSDGSEEKGSLTLGAKSSVKMVDHLHRNRHCFLITGEDGELMAHGETGRDTEKWLVFLRAHIRKAKHDAKHKK